MKGAISEATETEAVTFSGYTGTGCIGSFFFGPEPMSVRHRGHRGRKLP